MGIFPIWVVSATLLVVWVAMLDSRPMTDKQIKMLLRNMAKWESAPKVEKICHGNVFRKNNITTFKYQYDSPNGALCEAEYKIKVDQNNAKATQHKFECTEVPKEDPAEDDEPDFD